MRAFAFHRPESIDEAMAVHAADEANALLAGGTTLIDLVKLDVMQPERLVDINRLPLSRIERLPDGRLRVGALVKNSDFAWNEIVQRDYPLVAAALLAGASGQIRNMATTAGNLMQRTRCPYFRDNVSACNKRQPGSGCSALGGYNRMHAVLGVSDACIATHPSDLCVALAALEVEVNVRGPSEERVIPFGEFHLLPNGTPHLEHALHRDEIITAITLAAPRAGTRSRYVKLRDRESFEFALASAAVVLVVDGERIADARIALGGVATKPWRARAAEDRLRGAPANRKSFAAAADAALKDAQPREHNAFKVPLARQAIVRALEEAVGETHTP